MHLLSHLPTPTHPPTRPHTDRACVDLARLPHLEHLAVAQNLLVGDAGVTALAAGLGHCLLSFNLCYTSVTNSVLPLLAGVGAQALVAHGF